MNTDSSISALALLLLSSGLVTLTQAAGKQNLNHARTEFMNAMRDASIQKDQSDRKRQFKKNLLQIATPVGSSSLRRKLEDGQYYAAAADDYFDNGDEAVVDYGDFGFDMSSYSLKYAGCSAITTFSDEMAADNSDVSTIFSSMNYVIFRLCPTESCSASSTYGCTGDYGEYMVPMSQWLEIMTEYREEEFERYCEFCENCMAQERRLEDAAAAGDDAAEEEVEGDHACQYYNACSTYEDVCNQRRLDDVSDYFECTKVQYNGNYYYAGPHCSHDKTTIIIGLYEDQYCSKYINKYKASAYSALGFEDHAMANYYKEDCIACKESNLPYQVVDGDAEDDDEVTEMCENLYFASAKCNRNIAGASSASYLSNEQQDNSQATCSYIKSIVSGHYDEGGYIYVDGGSYRSDNKNNKYQSEETYAAVTGDQVLGILGLSTLFILLWLWSCCLRASLSTRAFKGPAQDPHAARAGYLSRSNSGIVMGRSRSFTPVV